MVEDQPSTPTEHLLCAPNRRQSLNSWASWEDRSKVYERANDRRVGHQELFITKLLQEFRKRGDLGR